MSYPTLNDRAVSYLWRQLAWRAGVADDKSSSTGFEGLPLSVRYEHPGSFRSAQRVIFVVPCAADAWQRLLRLPDGGVDWLPQDQVMPSGTRLPFDDPIPVLLWGDGLEHRCRPFAEKLADRAIVFYADILATTFFMLSRWEETVVPDRDQHDRFPATASVAYRQGFLDRPIVDEYALILREWLKVLLPGWQPKPRRFSFRISHDVDKLFHFRDWRVAARKLAGDLIRRRSLGRAWQTGVNMVAQATAPERIPSFQDVYRLADLSHKHNFRDDAFYFMAAERGPLENDYDPASPLVRRCIEELQEQGFEIGLHAGYQTVDDPKRLAAEKARLDAILGEKYYGSRQHYLRFRVPHTWRHLEQVGIRYDSTMAYADHEGFRCGTCQPYRPFDVEQDRELALRERPLIVMDGTLRDYRNLTPVEGERRILALAQRCSQVGGQFTLLWHNSSVSGEWRPWFGMYERVLEALDMMREHV